MRFLFWEEDDPGYWSIPLLSSLRLHNNQLYHPLQSLFLSILFASWLILSFSPLPFIHCVPVSAGSLEVSPLILCPTNLCLEKKKMTQRAFIQIRQSRCTSEAIGHWGICLHCLKFLYMPRSMARILVYHKSYGNWMIFFPFVLAQRICKDHCVSICPADMQGSYAISGTPKVSKLPNWCANH